MLPIQQAAEARDHPVIGLATRAEHVVSRGAQIPEEGREADLQQTADLRDVDRIRRRRRAR